MRSLLAYYADAVMAAAGRGAGCALECSGRGDCLNGTCLCEIRYAGEECAGPNLPYHACIGGVFLLVSFVCAVQLTVCIVSEYRRLKAPSLLKAFKVTTQKVLYMVAFLASLSRGAYFISPSPFQEGWATSLMSAYYPLLMSGSSLIVCFWAEVFHLRDIRWERPRFLSKSFLAFVTFNLIIYSLLAAEVLTTTVADTTAEKKSFYQHVFNGCYAVLLFVVVIFFLIYGVEVYFKVRGEFLKETKVCTIISSRAGSSGNADEDEASHTLVTKQGIETDLAASPQGRQVDVSQLHQSRLGLVSQALMLIIIAALLASETLADLWKSKVPVESRNWHDIVFRLAEIGVCVWFPCVLWNCMAPERLWILNPRRLLASQLEDKQLGPALLNANHYPPPVRFVVHLVNYWHREVYRVVALFVAKQRRLTEIAEVGPNSADSVEECPISVEECPTSVEKCPTSVEECPSSAELKPKVSVPGGEPDAEPATGRDCWICYDASRPEPLIRPCRCTGDVACVHHTCLRTWLVESAATVDGLKCKVCNTPYIVQQTNRVEWERGFTATHWTRVALGVACMCACALAACGVIRACAAPVPRVLAASAALLVFYVAVRFLGTSTIAAYQRAKVSSLKILTESEVNPKLDHLSTISRTVTVEIASKAMLEQALKDEVR